MTFSKKTTLQETVLANAQRIEHMGLQNHQAIGFLQKLSLSPIPDVACRFTGQLKHKLDQMEFNDAIYTRENVPTLSPETSIEIGLTVKQGLPLRMSITKAIHWLIAGASGSGKTNLFCVIEKAIRNIIPCTLIDHKDEGARFIHAVPNAAYIPLNKQRWNPLAGVGNQTDYIPYLSAQLAKLMALHPVTANAVRAKLLSLCSNKENLPSISDLAELFLILAKQETRSNLHTASRGFEDLAATMGRWGEVRQGKWPFNDQSLNVIPLKDVPPALEFFYISLLLKHMTDHASLKGHSTNLRHILFFDEALTYMGKEMEPTTGSGRTNHVAEMMRISRSYGFTIIAAVQSISKVQDTVVDNAGVFIAFRANSVQEAKHCCKRLGFDETRYMEIMNLEIGTAWVTAPHCRTPAKIKVPFVDLGDYPGEAAITRQMNPIWASWDNQAVFSPTATKTKVALDFREILGEAETPESLEQQASGEADNADETPYCPVTQPGRSSADTPLILSEYYTLLRSCDAHPDFGTTTHYKSMGWSGGRGNRVKTKLIELGWVEVARLVSPKGGRPKKTLRLTDKGQEVLHESA